MSNQEQQLVEGPHNTSREAEVAGLPKSLSDGGLRSLAMAGGDYRLVVIDEVHRVLDKVDRDPIRAIRHGLQRLRTDGFISSHEEEILSRVCDLIREAEVGNIEWEKATLAIRVLYEEMIAASSSNPVALAIGSIVSSGVCSFDTDSNDEAPVTVRMSRSNRIDTGTVGGVVAGAVTGGLIGGGAGAVMGAVIGGFVGAVVGACKK
jgi:hypothetical protein